MIPQNSSKLHYVGLRTHDSSVELYVDTWVLSWEWCVRCGTPLLDAADEETHYWRGLCSWCSYQWLKPEPNQRTKTEWEEEAA